MQKRTSIKAPVYSSHQRVNISPFLGNKTLLWNSSSKTSIKDVLLLLSISDRWWPRVWPAKQPDASWGDDNVVDHKNKIKYKTSRRLSRDANRTRKCDVYWFSFEICWCFSGKRRCAQLGGFRWDFKRVIILGNVLNTIPNGLFQFVWKLWTPFWSKNKTIFKFFLYFQYASEREYGFFLNSHVNPYTASDAIGNRTRDCSPSSYPSNWYGVRNFCFHF